MQFLCKYTEYSLPRPKKVARKRTFSPFFDEKKYSFVQKMPPPVPLGPLVRLASIAPLARPLFVRQNAETHPPAAPKKTEPLEPSGNRLPRKPLPIL